MDYVICYPSRLAIVKRRQHAEISSQHCDKENAHCAKGRQQSVTLEGFNARREIYLDK
jgi:hypothetical protein